MIAAEAKARQLGGLKQGSTAARSPINGRTGETTDEALGKIAGVGKTRRPDPGMSMSSMGSTIAANAAPKSRTPRAAQTAPKSPPGRPQRPNDTRRPGPDGSLPPPCPGPGRIGRLRASTVVGSGRPGAGFGAHGHRGRTRPGPLVWPFVRVFPGNYLIDPRLRRAG